MPAGPGPSTCKSTRGSITYLRLASRSVVDGVGTAVPLAGGLGDRDDADGIRSSPGLGTPLPIPLPRSGGGGLAVE
jgi:hypothetical protein